MRFIVAVLLLFVVLLSANFYIFFRLWHLIPVFPTSRIILVSIVVLLVVLPFISLAFGERFPFWVSSFMYRVGVSWLMIMLYFVILFFVLDMIRISGVIFLNQYMFNSWMGFGIVTLFITVLMTAGNINYHIKKRVELTITTNKNIEQPLKIVAFSDLHLGYGTGTKEFRKWVKLINREEPDIVLIAGDAVDNKVKPMYQRDFTNVFKEIKAKQGVFMAPGNHEYIAKIAQSIDFLTKTGITLLRDSITLVGNTFYLVGRDDKSNVKRKTIEELTFSLDKSKPIIMIDHQPEHIDEVEKNNIDLYFAGHTHNGQIFPVTLITKAIFELSYGYLKKGNTHFYVTSGLGIWGGKFRLGSRSEYVIINIE
jgi:predicted MPP superfamily phosphohydrolase